MLIQESGHQPQLTGCFQSPDRHQNTQEEKDRRRAENDYKVNLKTEIMIEALYDKINVILAKQSALEKQLQANSDNAAEKRKHFIATKIFENDNVQGAYFLRVRL